MYNIVTPVIADYKTTEDMIFSIAARYTALRLRTIGRTELNKKLYLLTFGDGYEKVLYAAAFHGQEWMTTLVLLRFIEELCCAVQVEGTLAGVDAKKAMQGRSLIFVPMVNPDGVDISLYGESAAGKNAELVMKASKGDFSSWNANANGVDINHNFNAGFKELQKMEQKEGIDKPSPRRYGGLYPESERETKAISDLCRKENICHAICLHSQGEEIYYEYGEHTPSKSALMAQVMSLSSGYEIKKQSGLASHGGCKDFIIDKLHKPAFTIEIGKGKNPLPLDDFKPIYDRIKEMLVLSIVL